MPPTVLAMQNVYKKFRLGEYYDSLRDVVPGLARRLLGRGPVGETELRRQEFWALQDVSFEVKAGEAFGIIGNNGAGKSTMLKLLSGIMKPTRGSLIVEGKLSALIEVGAGFHPDLTGRENVFLNGTILGMRREEIRRKFDEIVECSGLADFIDTPLKRYSSGMHARLGFSVAAHLEPDILVIDEVLSVGDFDFQRRSLAKMQAAIRGGATVVFVSHNLKAVADLCQRCILLERGRVTRSGSTGDVIRHYLESGGGGDAPGKDRDVYISRVSIRQHESSRVRIEAGEKVYVDVDITANRDCDRIAVVLDVKDDSLYHLFDTSTERLGAGNMSFKAGEKRTVTFELVMHLGPGTYYFGAILYRYDIQKEYHCLFPGATLFVSADRDARGAVNLYPRVVSMGSTVEALAEHSLLGGPPGRSPVDEGRAP